MSEARFDPRAGGIQAYVCDRCNEVHLRAIGPNGESLFEGVVPAASALALGGTLCSLALQLLSAGDLAMAEAQGQTKN